jgi:lipopolysaccharide transport system permease protein
MGISGRLVLPDRMRQSAPMSEPSRQVDAVAMPSVVIRPTQGWVGVNLRELWAFRELTYFFVWRDTKVRYRQTAFGVLWALFQPLALMAVFTLFLGRLNGIAPSGVPYPLFVLAALVPWTFVSKAVLAASDSLVRSSNLLQKVYFPRLIVPIAAIGAQVPDFAIGLVLLVVALFVVAVPLSPAIVAVVPLAGLGLLATLGLGAWLSALSVRFRDVREVVPLGLQLWLFASPIAYASSVVPAEWRWLYDMNPMVGLADGYRWALLGATSPAPTSAIAVGFIVTALVLVSGLAYFRRVERTFADVI